MLRRRGVLGVLHSPSTESRDEDQVGENGKASDMRDRQFKNEQGAKPNAGRPVCDQAHSTDAEHFTLTLAEVRCRDSRMAGAKSCIGDRVLASGTHYSGQFRRPIQSISR